MTDPQIAIPVGDVAPSRYPDDCPEVESTLDAPPLLDEHVAVLFDDGRFPVLLTRVSRLPYLTDDGVPVWQADQIAATLNDPDSQ